MTGGGVGTGDGVVDDGDVGLGGPGGGLGPGAGVGDDEDVGLGGPGGGTEVGRGANEVASSDLQSFLVVEPLADLVPPGQRKHESSDVPPSESL